jgi:hypothetical protein
MPASASFSSTVVELARYRRSHRVCSSSSRVDRLGVGWGRGTGAAVGNGASLRVNAEDMHDAHAAVDALRPRPPPPSDTSNWPVGATAPGKLLQYVVCQWQDGPGGAGGNGSNVAGLGNPVHDGHHLLQLTEGTRGRGGGRGGGRGTKGRGPTNDRGPRTRSGYITGTRGASAGRLSVGRTGGGAAQKRICLLPGRAHLSRWASKHATVAAAPRAPATVPTRSTLPCVSQRGQGALGAPWQHAGSMDLHHVTHKP